MHAHTSAAEWVCLVAHKVDFVWLTLTGRVLRSCISKCPPSSSVGLIWQDTMCVCTAVIFPPCFPAYLPCCWNQSPPEYSCFRSDLNVWVFVPVLTSSHRASLLSPQKDTLSLSRWFNGNTLVRLTALFAKLQIITSLWLGLYWLGTWLNPCSEYTATWLIIHEEMSRFVWANHVYNNITKKNRNLCHFKEWFHSFCMRNHGWM